MSFEQYVTEINVLAQKAFGWGPDRPYCDPAAWLDPYNDGDTPAEAWAAECNEAGQV